ncbi:MAG: hypothetical protein AB7U20_08330 [Planctomycetaceae bacterium]
MKACRPAAVIFRRHGGSKVLLGWTTIETKGSLGTAAARSQPLNLRCPPPQPVDAGIQGVTGALMRPPFHQLLKER